MKQYKRNLVGGKYFWVHKRLFKLTIMQHKKVKIVEIQNVLIIRNQSIEEQF